MDMIHGIPNSDLIELFRYLHGIHQDELANLDVEKKLSGEPDSPVSVLQMVFENGRYINGRNVDILTYMDSIMMMQGDLSTIKSEKYRIESELADSKNKIDALEGQISAQKSHMAVIEKKLEELLNARDS